MHLLTMKKPNTQITYRYCDPDNYKYWASFVVRGKIQRSELKPYMFDTDQFVPERIGLKHALIDPWSRTDHLIHEFWKFKPTDSKDCVCTAKQLIKKFKEASNGWWFEGLL